MDMRVVFSFGFVCLFVHFLAIAKRVTNLNSILKSRDIMLLANVRIVKAMVFPAWFFNCQDVRVELQRRLSTKELMLSNCGVGQDS